MIVYYVIGGVAALALVFAVSSRKQKASDLDKLLAEQDALEATPEYQKSKAASQAKTKKTAATKGTDDYNRRFAVLDRASKRG